jgi:hypothetical protein
MALAVFRLLVEKTAHLVTIAGRLIAVGTVALSEEEDPGGR